LKILTFKSSAEFRRWLEINHAGSDGIWLRIFKKESGKKSITYAEALDQSLCYGWIDGQKQAYDECSWLQKFTPRRVKSGWSKINTEHAERLIKARQMSLSHVRQFVGCLTLEGLSRGILVTNARFSPASHEVAMKSPKLLLLLTIEDLIALDKEGLTQKLLN